MGAIAHDSPFYAVGFRNGRFLADIGDALHGVHGEDTLARFGPFFAGEHASADRTAFLAGALTHYAADVTIHPLVNFFCNGNRAAARRHRAFETCLDLYVTAETGEPDGTGDGMRGILASCDVRRLASLAADFYLPGGAEAGEKIRRFDFLRLLKRHAFIRDRFERRAWRFASRLLGAAGGAARVLTATFYPGPARARAIMPSLAAFFAGPIRFIHPRTGVQASTTAFDLIEAAASLAVELMRRLGTSGTVPRGYSLDAGCDVDKYPDEKFLRNAPRDRNDDYFRDFPWW